MQIVLNGQSTEVPEAASLQALLEQLALSGRRVALEVNGEIVPRSRHADTALRPGDRVEIVHAIGGG